MVQIPVILANAFQLSTGADRFRNRRTIVASIEDFMGCRRGRFRWRYCAPSPITGSWVKSVVIFSDFPIILRRASEKISLDQI